LIIGAQRDRFHRGHRSISDIPIDLEAITQKRRQVRIVNSIRVVGCIAKQDLPEAAKAYLSNLTPATYIGNAAAQAKRIREELASVEGSC